MTLDLGDGQRLRAGVRLTLDDSERHPTAVGETSDTHRPNLVRTLLGCPGRLVGMGLPATTWLALSAAHEKRADSLTAGHRARKATGQRHAIDDFLYDYYGTRPAVLRRWHPGVGVRLEPGPDGPAPHRRWRWYATDADG